MTCPKELFHKNGRNIDRLAAQYAAYTQWQCMMDFETEVLLP